jgi:Transposase IS4
VQPWANTGCIVVADSYFTSVQAAIRLWGIGLCFIGTVKTATKQFPMSYLGSCIMHAGRGDRRALLSRMPNDPCTLMAYCWIDRDRRYFISTCSSMAPGNPCIRWRWTQVAVTSTGLLPIYQEVIVQQPQSTEIYYNSCARIDQHNKYRQVELMLERKVKTKEWWRRVSHTVLSMCVVDAYLLMVGC